MTEEEWGPWIEHDGKGCPCAGVWVAVVLANNERFEGLATGRYNKDGSAWDWASIPSSWKHRSVIRYRIRKPRGLTILEGLLTDLPERVDA